MIWMDTDLDPPSSTASRREIAYDHTTVKRATSWYRLRPMNQMMQNFDKSDISLLFLPDGNPCFLGRRIPKKKRQVGQRD